MADIRISQENHFLTVTIDRPAKKNALTRSMYEQLTNALERLNTDPELRGLVISAAGDTFSAGNDINDFIAAPDTGGDSPQARFLYALSSANKPLLAAVNGPAIGIGFTLLLHCDLVYATPEASFAAPFGQLGLTPEAASSQLLPARIGVLLATEIFLLGRRLTAQEALAHGLINRIVDAAALSDTVGQAARQLSALPADAVTMTKQLLRQNAEPVPDRLAREFEQFAERLKSAETQAILARFMEKR